MSDQINSFSVEEKYSLKNIEIREQSLNIPEGFNLKNNPNLQFTIDTGVGKDTPLNLIYILVTYIFEGDGTVLLKLVVANEYQVEDMSNHFKDGMAIKSEFMDNLVRLSIHHTRGIHATIIKNTLLDKLYIPMLKE